jgi:DHA1 family inner membrane transport protein
MKYNKIEKSLLALFSITKFTHILDFMIMMPLGPRLMKEFEISPAEFSWLIASYTISAGVAVLISSLFVDGFKRKPLLLFVYGGFILGTLGCGLAINFYTLLIARMIAGVFGGILNALILSTVGDFFPLEKRAGAMGIVLSAFSLASALGVPIALCVANMGEWNWPFLLLVIVSLPILLSMYYILPDFKVKIVEKSSSLENSFRHNFTDAAPALFMNIALILGQFMIIPMISPYMVGNNGLTNNDLVYIYLLGGLVTMLTGPYIGRLADKKGHLFIFRWAAIFSLVPIILITQISQGSIGLVLFVTTLFFIFISGRVIPSVTIVVSSVLPQFRASFTSVNTALQQFSAGVAALLTGIFISEMEQGKNIAPKLAGFDYVGYCALGLTCLAIAISFKIKAAKS